jgi:glycosyltransferase involved in cell wall biosynthesis
MTPSISVIVPVFNVEHYLRRCLDSISAQTFAEFEVVLVDDGSTDGSADICREYVDRDRRFRLVQQENGGLSAARNAGIEHSCGTFLSFIDGDDAVAPRMLEVLHDLITKHEASMSVCSINNVYGSRIVPQYPTQETFVCDGQEALRLTLEGKRIPGSICCKLLRRSDLGSVRFPIGLTYEDAYFIMQLTNSLRQVAVTTEPLYQYYHREQSITTVRFSPKALDVITVYAFVLEQIRVQYPALIRQAEFRYYWAHFVVLDRMLLTGNRDTLKEHRVIITTLREHVKDIVSNPFFEKARKLAARALALNLGLYRLLLAMQQRRLWKKA